MPILLITGSNGQVGNELQQLAEQYPNWRFIFTDVDDLDITSSDAVFEYFKKYDIDYCINCAAYTAVDKAESNEALATAINVDGPKHLAQACTLHEAKLIQLSTDYVYHNDQNAPFKEGDTTNPQSVYASTKLAGDQVAQQIHPTTMVIRTSWVYSTFGHNFVKTMRRLGKERDQLNIVFDQIGTPTYAHDLASAMLTIIHKIEEDVISDNLFGGIYHYSNEGVTSWYDFARAVFDLSGIECATFPIETVQYPTPAKRPPFSVLNKGKIKAAFDITIPHWRDSLAKCVQKLEQSEQIMS